MIITRTKEDNGFAPVSVRCERRPSNSFRRRGEKATARNRIETAQVSAMRAYCERHEGSWDKKLFGTALSSRDRATRLHRNGKTQMRATAFRIACRLRWAARACGRQHARGGRKFLARWKKKSASGESGVWRHAPRPIRRRRRSAKCFGCAPNAPPAGPQNPCPAGVFAAFGAARFHQSGQQDAPCLEGLPKQPPVLL